jgi:hypothetical protein
MPNNTDNRVILSHDNTEAVDMIYNIMNTEDTPLCETLIPMDTALLNSGGWYDWRIENWGTKWEIYDATCDRMDANTLVLYFYTAWSPPFPIFDKLVSMGFEVNARYLDEGWMYIGEYNSDGNHVHFDNVEDVVTEYPELDYEFDIGETIQDMRDSGDPHYGDPESKEMENA